MKSQEHWLDEKIHHIRGNLKQEHGPLGHTGDTWAGICNTEGVKQLHSEHVC